MTTYELFVSDRQIGHRVYKYGEFGSLEAAMLALHPGDEGQLFIKGEDNLSVHFAYSYRDVVDFPENHQRVVYQGWEMPDGRRIRINARHEVWDYTKINPLSGAVIGSGAWHIMFVTGMRMIDRVSGIHPRNDGGPF